MSQINYRSIEKRDYETACKIISDSFGLSRYFSDTSTLVALQKHYLYSCLAEASYTCVAEKDNCVIGIIMGNAKGDIHLAKRITFMVKMLYYSFKMKYLAKRNHVTIEDYKNLHAIYHSFNSKHKGEFNGVLTLFAVTESARGHGVGKQLWSNLKDYLATKGATPIYLYTDSTCNTGFYDKQGFHCLENQNLTVTRDQKKCDIEIYLYSYELKKSV